MASTKALLDELRELNQRTFKGTPEDLVAWRHAVPDEEAPIDDLAKAALAIMTLLAEEAVKHQLPMMPDY